MTTWIRRPTWIRRLLGRLLPSPQYVSLRFNPVTLADAIAHSMANHPSAWRLVSGYHHNDSYIVHKEVRVAVAIQRSFDALLVVVAGQCYQVGWRQRGVIIRAADLWLANSIAEADSPLRAAFADPPQPAT